MGNVQNYLTPSKQRVKIITVDPTTRRVEGTLKDGSMIQIAVWEVPSFFRWPNPGEWWTVTRQNGVWMLGSYMEEAINNHKIEDTGIGEAKVNADTIKTASGNDVMAIDQPSVTTGSPVIWDGTKWTTDLAPIIASVWQPGDLKAAAYASPDPGWLLCDGAAISRTTYAALFARLGTTWGAGDGSTTFNVPDGRGRASVMAGSGAGLTTRALGSNGGEETHALGSGEMPTHSHGASADAQLGGAFPPQFPPLSVPLTIRPTFPSGSSSIPLLANNINADWQQINLNHSHNISVGNAGGGGAHNNMQPWFALNWFIKT